MLAKLASDHFPVDKISDTLQVKQCQASGAVRTRLESSGFCTETMPGARLQIEELACRDLFRLMIFCSEKCRRNVTKTTASSVNS